MSEPDSTAPHESEPPPDLLKAIGERLRARRLRRKTTQAELAATLGVTPATIARYEAGDRNLSVGTLLALAHALNVPAATLLGEEPPRPPLHPALQSLVRILTQHPEWLDDVADLIEDRLTPRAP